MKTNTSIRPGISIKRENGQTLNLTFEEFWLLCRKGTDIETEDEVSDFLDNSDEICGVKTSKITSDIKKKIVDETIKTRITRETPDDIYDASLTVLREEGLLHD